MHDTATIVQPWATFAWCVLPWPFVVLGILFELRLDVTGERMVTSTIPAEIDERLQSPERQPRSGRPTSGINLSVAPHEAGSSGERQASGSRARLPDALVKRLTRPFSQFLRIEAAGGAVLLCVIRLRPTLF
jgi:hypothetical protein